MWISGKGVLESGAEVRQHNSHPHCVGLVPMAVFVVVLSLFYQVARLFHFVSSLDHREGQVTRLRGVTNSQLIQSGQEAKVPPVPTDTCAGSEAGVAPALTPVCVCVRLCAQHTELPPTKHTPCSFRSLSVFVWEPLT